MRLPPDLLAIEGARRTRPPNDDPRSICRTVWRPLDRCDEAIPRPLEDGRRLIDGDAVDRCMPRFVERPVERRDELALRPEGRDLVEDRAERRDDERALLDRDRLELEREAEDRREDDLDRLTPDRLDRLGRDERDALRLDRLGDDLRTDRDDELRLLLEADRDEPLLRGGPASSSATATTAKSAATAKGR